MGGMNYIDRIVGRGSVDPSTLAANPRNWRRHPKSQGIALDGLLERVGWVREVLVNQRTGRMIDGHLRLELAVGRGEASVPVTYVDLSPEEELLVLATLDPVAALADDDSERLDAILKDVGVTGNAGVDKLLRSLVSDGKNDGLTDPDAIPEPPDAPATQFGDLIVLGRHRLLCGNSANPMSVEMLLGDERIQLVNTDPPYNVRVEPRSNNAIAANLAAGGRGSQKGNVPPEQLDHMHHQGLDL